LSSEYQFAASTTDELIDKLLISPCTAGAELAPLLAWERWWRIVSESYGGRRGNDRRKNIIIERKER
jgi:hypothetical protein